MAGTSITLLLHGYFVEGWVRPAKDSEVFILHQQQVRSPALGGKAGEKENPFVTLTGCEGKDEEGLFRSSASPYFDRWLVQLRLSWTALFLFPGDVVSGHSHPERHSSSSRPDAARLAQDCIGLGFLSSGHLEIDFPLAENQVAASLLVCGPADWCLWFRFSMPFCQILL